MRLSVLGSSSNWHLHDLQRAAGDLHIVDPIPFTRLHAIVRENASIVASREGPLSDFDATYVRAMPAGSLEQVVFRMDVLAIHEAQGGVVVNSAKSLEVSIDKFLTLSRLQSVGFEVPMTIVCQDFRDMQLAIHQFGGDEVVVKPVFGGEGRGIRKICWKDDAEVLHEIVRDGQILYLQRFIPHDGRDIRLFVVGDRVIGMQRVADGDWRTNISLGATGVPLKITSELGEMGMRAAGAVGAEVCAIDLLPAKDGRIMALEVNSVPGWRALAEITGIDVAELVLNHLDLLSRSTLE